MNKQTIDVQYTAYYLKHINVSTCLGEVKCAYSCKGIGLAMLAIQYAAVRCAQCTSQNQRCRIFYRSCAVHTLRFLEAHDGLYSRPNWAPCTVSRMPLDTDRGCYRLRVAHRTTSVNLSRISMCALLPRQDSICLLYTSPSPRD